MKNSQSTQDTKPSTHASHEPKTEQQNNQTADGPVADSGSLSASSNDSRKVSRQDIELVQNLIERCLQLYMTRDEVVKTLLNRARIDPGFTTLVWQKLEEENADFFSAYYIRLKLKKQIILFNHLLEHQYHLMKYPVPPKVPLAPIQNGIHPIPVNNLPMGYPVLQQPPIPVTGQPHIDSMGISSCHMVDGVPASSNFQPMRMNSGNDMVMDNNASDAIHTFPPTTAMPSMSEMPGPDNGAGNSRDSLRSFDQIQWNFSLTDLTADLSNLGDLGALGNYPGSPFLPSDSEMLLDSSEQEDIVEEFFVDSVPVQLCSPYDEEKS
ncbi:uncharacterized protein LOC120207191 [Hibiscus syriacus]|nr:uncharacterized protein LOC120207191 [Hibiscus syriacus]XP_039062640.1 uncharacterized protein LOC120207191 [Hibiscus syriacus]